MSDDFCSHGRDRPLGFHHRIGRAVLDSLGLPKPKNEHREIARAAILAEAILAHDEGKTVSYSRRREFYTGRQRYMGPAYTYANVISEIDVLGSAGLLEEQRAKSGSRDWQSTFCATPALHSVCSSSGYWDFSFQLHDPIKLVIKGSDGRRHWIPYRDTAATRAMRREIEGINADYSGLVLDLPSVEKTDHHWIVEESTIRPTPLILYRVSIEAAGSVGEGLRILATAAQMFQGSAAHQWRACCGTGLPRIARCVNLRQTRDASGRGPLRDRRV